MREQILLTGDMAIGYYQSLKKMNVKGGFFCGNFNVWVGFISENGKNVIEHHFDEYEQLHQFLHGEWEETMVGGGIE